MVASFPTGQGVPKDESEALKYFETAVEHDLKEAQFLHAGVRENLAMRELSC
jgi:TPR repeat protein